jgi:predicted N-acetyltransferase YhbS
VSTVVVRPLRERPQWIPLLADWHYAELGALFGADLSRALAEQELREHAAHAALPNTWVAERDGTLLGSVSVVLEDAPALNHLGGPWLASLYVRPEARGEGIGRQLVHCAEDGARAAGCESLLLFTPRHADWYAALDWKTVLNMLLHQQPVAVMRRDLGRSA